MLDGPDGNKIDCMFFPCTSKEEVILDDSISLDGTKHYRKRTPDNRRRTSSAGRSNKDNNNT